MDMRIGPTTNGLGNAWHLAMQGRDTGQHLRVLEQRRTDAQDAPAQRYRRIYRLYRRPPRVMRAANLTECTQGGTRERAVDARLKGGWFGWQAAKRGDSRMVRALLDMRAVVDDIDHVGRSALHVAVRGGHLGVLGVLLKRGADANLQASALRSQAPVHMPVLLKYI